MFPLHNLDEVVDNTNIFGFLRAVFNLQHVAKFWYQKIHKRDRWKFTGSVLRWFVWSETISFTLPIRHSIDQDFFKSQSIKFP